MLPDDTPATQAPAPASAKDTGEPTQPTSDETEAPTTTTEQPSAPTTPGKKIGGLGRLTGFAKRHKKGGYIGGIVGAAIIASIIGFVLILPFKALHFLQIIQDKTFARVQQTVEIRTEKQLDRYIEKRLESTSAPAWGHAKNGYGIVATGDISHDLYANWVGSNFEQNYSDKYGISFERTSNGHYNVLQNGVPLEIPSANGEKVALENLGNNAFRQQIKDATAKETHWYSILQRHQMRVALFERYGVSHWIFFSKLRQNVQDVKIAAKKAVYNALNNNIVAPVSSHAGQYFACVINGGDACKQLPGEPSDSAVTPPEQSTAPTDKQDPKKLDQQAGDAVTKAVDSAESSASNSISQAGADAIDKTVTDTATTEVIQQTEDQALADATASATTGPLTFGLGLVKVLDKIGGSLKPGGAAQKVITSKNSQQYADFFSTHATAIDQIKAGEAVTGPKSGVLAAFANFGIQFKAFAADSATPTNSGYTQVDAYNELLGDPTESRIYKKYYAGDNIDNIKDNNKCVGKPEPAGQVICPDQKIVPDINAEVQSNPFLNIVYKVHQYYQDAGGGILSTISDIASNVIGSVLSATGLQSVMDALVSGLLSALHLDKLIGAGVNLVTKYFFGPILTGVESGGRWFDAMVAGAGVVSNASSQLLGSIPLTPLQTSQWNAKIQDVEIAKTQGVHGVWYKIASLDSANSIASRVLTWSPGSLSQVPTKFAGLVGGLFNPQTMFGAGKYLGSVLIPGNHLAFADAPQYQSPFGDVQWGYPLNDPYLNMSADQLDAICQPGSASRAQMDSDYQADLAHFNQNPYDPVNNPGGNRMTKTDPCLLEQAAINNLGAYFTGPEVDNAGVQSSAGSQVSAP